MKTVKAVIGANYGDEGKGLLTDRFAAWHPDSLVIRMNGGAQAGHTVVTPNGERQVFSHVGSGTFAGCPTWLSPEFVANPRMLLRECDELAAIGIRPAVHVDGDCMVTTPFDVLINQAAEAARGTSRHGSCGMGFNETIERSTASEAGDFGLRVRDLTNPARVREILDEIKCRWLPFRMGRLGIGALPPHLEALLASDALESGFALEAEAFIRLIRVADAGLLEKSGTLLFEGAQGLLLDQNHPNFPHVTRSNTGLENVAALLRSTGVAVGDFEACHVTRAYLTRHGAGPMPGETHDKPAQGIEDPTNLPNPHQGSLRFGLLDPMALAAAIRTDLRHAAGFPVRTTLAVTCLDQMDDRIPVLVGGATVPVERDALPGLLADCCGSDRLIVSEGSCRTDVRRVEETASAASVPAGRRSTPEASVPVSRQVRFCSLSRSASAQTC